MEIIIAVLKSSIGYLSKKLIDWGFKKIEDNKASANKEFNGHEKQIPYSHLHYVIGDTLKPLAGYKFVFCYGNFLVPEYLLEALVRSEENIDYVPVKLKGYELAWGMPTARSNLVDKAYLSVGSSRLWLSLTAVSNPLSCINGAIVRVSDAEFSELVLRESNYDVKPLDQYDFETQDIAMPYGDIYFFEPKRSPSEDVLAEHHYAVRQESIEKIAAMQQELGFDDELPAYPANTKVIDAYVPDTLFAKSVHDSDINLADYSDSLYHALKAHTHIEGVEYEINTSTRPILLSDDIFNEIKSTAEAVVSVCSKGLDGLLSDEELLDRSNYKDTDIELSKNTSGENTSTPTIARVDMTLFQDKVHVFELNGDSPGGMFHIDFLCQKFSKYFSGKPDLPDNIDFKANQETCVAIRQAIHSACQDRQTGDGPINVVMLEVNPKSQNTFPEFTYFADEISNEHIRFSICEPNEIAMSADKEEKLLVNNTPVDVIYKRALIQDLENEKYVQCFHLIRDAINKGWVCCINSLRSRLSGTKVLLAMMSDTHFQEKYLKNIPQKQQDVLDSCIPKAEIWDTALLNTTKERVFKNINHYILKSFDGYGGGGVFLGSNTAKTRKQFEDALKDKDSGYIVQKKKPHGRALMPIVSHGKVRWRYMYYVLGAYVIDGQCIAIEAKYSDTPKVNLKNGFRTAVFPVGR